MKDEINVTYSVVAYSCTIIEDDPNIIDSLNYSNTLSEVFNFIDDWSVTGVVDYFFIKTMVNSEVVCEEKLTKFC